MDFPTCQQCNGYGIISIMNYWGNDSTYKCTVCNGYGVIRYSIKRIQSNIWIVYSPDRTEFFIEHSFNDAIVRMDLHASKRYGRLEMQ